MTVEFEYIKLVANRIHKKHNYIRREDLISMGFIPYLKAVKTFDPTKGKYESYIKSKVYNGILDAIRVEYKRFEHQRIKTTELFDNNIKEIREHIFSDDIKYYLDKITGRDRQIIELYYLKGLNLVEVGKIVGLSPFRTSQIKTKALSEMRKK